MRPRLNMAWAPAALVCLLLFTPGCVIRRGFVVQFDWSLRAHRTGCRQPLFKARCRACDAAPCETAGTGAHGCDSCGHGALGGIRRALRGEILPPPAPEPPAPASFHPIPTRPVYGPRAEEPDAYEVPLRPLPTAPAEQDRDETGEPRPEDDDEVPSESEEMAPAQDDEQVPDEQSTLQLRDPRRQVRSVAWRTVKTEKVVPVPECKTCTVRFKD
jgi:hypothetical protein